jgi:hypothetical protein
MCGTLHPPHPVFPHGVVLNYTEGQLYLCLSLISCQIYILEWKTGGDSDLYKVLAGGTK